jgi:predicted DNA-binding ribbon-helix-helix protein
MPTQQARRERHLGRHGERARLSANTKAQLDRLARRNDYTVTALIEELVASAEHWVTARLSGKGSSDITGANRHCVVAPRIVTR